CLADKPSQRVPRLLGRCGRTRLVGAAGAVHLARRDPGEPDARPFGAPDRTIAIPDAGRRALEGLTSRHYGNGSEKQEAHHLPYDSLPMPSPPPPPRADVVGGRKRSQAARPIRSSIRAAMSLA